MPADWIGLSLVRANDAVFVRRVEAAAWRTLLLISWIGFSPRLPFGNGCCPFLTRYDIASPTMPASSGMCFRYLCARCSRRFAAEAASLRQTGRQDVAPSHSCSGSETP